MNGPAWTRDEDAALMLLVNARMPYREIAVQMARTFAAVAMRVCRLRHGRPQDKGRRGWDAPRAPRYPPVLRMRDVHERRPWDP